MKFCVEFICDSIPIFSPVKFRNVKFMGSCKFNEGVDDVFDLFPRKDWMLRTAMGFGSGTLHGWELSLVKVLCGLLELNSGWYLN